MGTRLELQTLFEGIADHVYFQPPNGLSMQYPCIIYNRDSSDTKHADNIPFSRTKRYQVTVIDRNPDSQLPDKVEELPYCSFDRYFAAESLNHFVFNIFF